MATQYPDILQDPAGWLKAYRADTDKLRAYAADTESLIATQRKMLETTKAMMAPRPVRYCVTYGLAVFFPLCSAALLFADWLNLFGAWPQ